MQENPSKQPQDDDDDEIPDLEDVK